MYLPGNKFYRYQVPKNKLPERNTWGVYLVEHASYQVKLSGKIINLCQVSNELYLHDNITCQYEKIYLVKYR